MDETWTIMYRYELRSAARHSLEFDLVTLNASRYADACQHIQLGKIAVKV